VLRNFQGRPAVVIAAVLVAVSVAGCAGKSKKPTLAYEERPVELLYATGADRLDRGNWNEAVDYFREVERQHPYSIWARRAQLMGAFAYYLDADRFNRVFTSGRRSRYGSPSLSNLCDADLSPHHLEPDRRPAINGGNRGQSLRRR